MCVCVCVCVCLFVSGRIFSGRGAGGGVCDSPLPCLELAFILSCVFVVSVQRAVGRHRRRDV